MKSAVAFAMAWLAAWCQVALVATMSWGAVGAGPGVPDGTPICHADVEQGQPQPAQPVHHGHDCVLCTICQFHGGFVVVPASAVTPNSRNAITLANFAMAQPRAPPLSPPIAAQPRGPPFLS
ncbi:MAG TPA: hypothetical protein VH855_24225 [Acetobacteraceae bacterium]|jgi:hypothetical protein